jgi:hypothetical protein
MEPIQIDVFFPVPEGWGMCTTCEVMMAQANLSQAPQERGLDEYPPEWKEEFQRLTTTILTLADRYQEHLQIRIWDPRSLQGLVKSIRYGVRRYPTFIVNRHSKVTGWNPDQLEQHIRAAGSFSNSEI